jgi:hypothetical protein
MPSTGGYFATSRTPDGLDSYKWNDVPKSLDEHLDKVAPKGIASLSVGHGGCWVVILKDGSMTWCGVSDQLKKRLRLMPEVRLKLVFGTSTSIAGLITLCSQ